MKQTTVIAIIMLMAAALSSQNFEFHFDAVSVVHGQSHQNSFSEGVIKLSHSQVEWQSGHAEDLHYLGKTTINHPNLGVYTQYAWARLDSPGELYIGLKVIEGNPFQVTVTAPDHVFVSGDQIRREDCMVVYTDMEGDSYAIRRN